MSNKKKSTKDFPSGTESTKSPVTEVFSEYLHNTPCSKFQDAILAHRNKNTEFL